MVIASASELNGYVRDLNLNMNLNQNPIPDDPKKVCHGNRTPGVCVARIWMVISGRAMKCASIIGEAKTLHFFKYLH